MAFLSIIGFEKDFDTKNIPFFSLQHENVSNSSNEVKIFLILHPEYFEYLLLMILIFTTI